jgi:sarcosine oxidase, subunit alpha
VGRVTSATMSAAAGSSIALALLRRGRARRGETVTIHQTGRQVRANVTKPVFHDPDGVRLRA